MTYLYLQKYLYPYLYLQQLVLYLYCSLCDCIVRLIALLGLNVR